MSANTSQSTPLLTIDTHLMPVDESGLDDFVTLIFDTLSDHLPKHKTQHARYRNAVAVLLTNVLCAQNQGTALELPRNRTRWLNETKSPYGNQNLGYTVMTNTQLWLAQNNWIDVRLGSGESLVEQKTFGITRQPSRVYATQKLIDAMKDIHVFEDCISRTPEIIFLKQGFHDGRSRSLVKMRDFEEQNEITELAEHKKFVTQLNNFTRSLDLAYLGKTYVNLTQKTYWKAFFSLDDSQPVSLDYGGRYYGHWIQSLPKEEWTNIQINSSQVAQLSIEGCQLALLYAKHGLRTPDSNPFELSNTAPSSPEMTEAVKYAIEEMLISTKYIDRKPEVIKTITQHHKWSKFQQDIYNRHPVLRKAAYTGEGLELTHHESELFTLIMKDLMPRNIPFLYIFDTLLVPSEKIETVSKTMQEVFTFYTKEMFHNPVQPHILKKYK